MPKPKNDLNHHVRNGLMAIQRGLNIIEKAKKRIEVANDTFDLGTIKPRPLIVSPTGGPPRKVDSHGMGHYGAPRGAKIHHGTDYVGKPGQNIVTPITGVVIRESRPYRDSNYSGLLIRSPVLNVKLFYFAPDHSVIGKGVIKGKTTIGVMQDISKRYKDITPHVHLKAEINPEYLREA